MSRRFPYWISFILVATSCGSSGTVGPDGGGGGGGGGGGSASETKSGTLTIESTHYTVSNTDVEQGYASGTFYRIPPVTQSSSNGCSSETYGVCEVQTCMFHSTPSDGGTSITYTDAGPVTISGVLVNDGTMSLTPGAYGYDTVSGAVALFDGGASVRFVAPGNPDGAPAFDVSLVAPSSVQITAPQFVQGHVAASASHDLSVTWAGTSAANVTVQLAAGTSSSSAVARCAFTGSAGHGTVPAAAISAVGAIGGSASILVISESRTTKQLDGWNIAFSLQSYGILPSGIAAGALDIQ